MSGLVYAVGMGPGSEDLITPRAVSAIQNSDVIVGYTNYLKLYPQKLWEGKEIISTGMRGEVERCTSALKNAAAGRTVSVICSGDAGVYAMAGLLLELIDKNSEFADLSFEAVPGVTASLAAGAVLGAPLMNDFATISLSDLMTPQEIIKKRLKAVAAADMVCVLYNPASRRRRDLIRFAVNEFSESQGGNGLVGIVHHATRPDEESYITTLDKFPFDEIAMNTVVIFGNSQTVCRNNRMYTQRGYQDKYSDKFA